MLNVCLHFKLIIWRKKKREGDVEPPSYSMMLYRALSKRIEDYEFMSIKIYEQ